MEEKRILITGGSGFIGTNAVEYYAQKGYQVLNLDIKPPQNKDHNSFWIQCDILDLNKLYKLTKEFEPHYFLHLAARTDLKESKDIKGYATNIDGVKNVIEIVNSCQNLKRVIFASSRMVCKIGYQPKDELDYCPPNLYGQSKVIGENLVHKAKINSEWEIIRLTSIWGPWFDVPYKIFFTTIQKKIYFNPGKFNPQKSFGFVGNTVYQIDKLLHANVNLVNKKTCYVCDYPPLSLRKWADLISKAMKLRPILTVPYPLLKIVGAFGDILAGLGWYRVPLTTFRLNNLITNMVYDTKSLENICGKLPFNIEKGVKQTVAWMNSHCKYKSL